MNGLPKDTTNKIPLREEQNGNEFETGLDLQIFLDALPFYVMVIDEDHIIQKTNKALQQVLGTSMNEIIGKYCPKLIHGMDSPFQGCPLETAVRDCQVVEREMFDPEPGRWVKLAVYPTGQRTEEGKALYIHMVHDITEKKLAQEEIQRNYDIQTVLNKLINISLQITSIEDMLEQFFEQITSISWLTLDSRGGIFLVEDEPDVLVMKAHHGLAKPLLTTCSEVPFGKCLCGRAASLGMVVFADHLDERHENRYEGISPHGHYCVPIKSLGVVLGVINLYLKEGCSRDEKVEDFLLSIANVLAQIIERKKAEQGLIHSDKLAGIGILSAGIVHEINNPLSGISGYAEIILEEKDPDRIKEYVTKILKNTQRATTVLNLLSKQTRDGRYTETATVDLNQTIDETLETLNHTRTLYDIEIVRKYQDNANILGNSTELSQVFMNLMNNAVDAMSGRGRLTLSTNVDKDFVNINISDTGNGIPQKNLSRIFNPFFTTKDVGKGTGLGLYVSSMIIKKHQGMIDIDSEEGKGTTFTMRFPVSEVGT